MKNKIKVLLLVLFLVIMATLVFKVYDTINTKTNTQLGRLTEFAMRTMNNRTFSRLDLETDRKKIFVHFNSQCDICQNEALKFRENQSDLKMFQILFVSTEQPDMIVQFASDYELLKVENITFLYDQDKEFEKWTNSSRVPYILVYDEHDVLIYKHKGITDFAELLKVLERAD
ncbi:redoxin domain-containing protein [uncultured Croceitalea sp.]|uniref:peroxiredoxin family protein n=1 Tax=uncultured Croceitalea sp. TaxID=1798908 RepID=UPI003305BEEE